MQVGFITIQVSSNHVLSKPGLYSQAATHWGISSEATRRPSFMAHFDTALELMRAFSLRAFNFLSQSTERSSHTNARINRDDWGISWCLNSVYACMHTYVQMFDTNWLMRDCHNYVSWLSFTKHGQEEGYTTLFFFIVPCLCVCLKHISVMTSCKYDGFRGHACRLAVAILMILNKHWSVVCPAYCKTSNNQWLKGMPLLGMWVLLGYPWNVGDYNRIAQIHSTEGMESPLTKEKCSILTSSNLSKEAPSCMNSGTCFCQLNS